jgi:hypothetical protein
VRSEVREHQDAAIVAVGEGGEVERRVPPSCASRRVCERYLP